MAAGPWRFLEYRIRGMANRVLVLAPPALTAGATDGRFLRAAGIPTYGHSGVATDIFDIRAHGKDERVGVQAMFEAEEYLYELVKALSGG
jgi:acetylornithine deacetylase/succinyl-diaminopimelate desuccinylase-like protein